MDKKTIVALVVCVVLLIFWGQIAQYFGLIKESEPIQYTQTHTDSTMPSPGAVAEPVAADYSSRPLDTASSTIAAIDSLIPEEEIIVTTPFYELTFTNYGGGIKKIVLLDYDYSGSGHVIMADYSGEIVPGFEANRGGFNAGRLVFECDQQGFDIGAGSSPRKIEFTSVNQEGGRIIRSYTINPDGYDFDFDLTVEGIESYGFDRSYQLVWGITPPPTEVTNIEDDYTYYKVVALMSGELEEFDDYDNNRMNIDNPGLTSWVGLRTKYFAALMIPRTNSAQGIIARGTEQQAMINNEAVDARTLTAMLDMPLPSRGTFSDSYTLYVGPIDYNRLKSYEIGLEELTELGFIIIKPFSIAIIWLLPKIYSVIPNYGLVVLIFAFLIKVITYPLSKKQNVAMAKMKDLQPKMKALQEKYKNDPTKLNKQMMKLYKEAGANPLSGCLPMLPQMPLFFALFTVFRTTIELRGAYFLGWITDLSVPDPLYILPIIMVVVMFVQQKTTMTDPKNKMLTYLMPLFFGYISFSFPAGLVLYWTSFSLLSYFETLFVRSRQTQVVVVEGKK